MALKYVVAGTSPLSDWSNDLNILLMDAVAAKWATDITDPPVEYVTFNDTWWDGASDIQLTFKYLREDYDPTRRDNAWIRSNTVAFMDVHLWIKKSHLGDGPNPNYRFKVKKAFHDIIELNRKTLLPPATLVVLDITEMQEDDDHLQDLIHFKADVNAYYDKVQIEA